jgi:hypothetical protein
MYKSGGQSLWCVLGLAAEVITTKILPGLFNIFRRDISRYLPPACLYSPVFAAFQFMQLRQTSAEHTFVGSKLVSILSEIDSIYRTVCEWVFIYSYNISHAKHT